MNQKKKRNVSSSLAPLKEMARTPLIDRLMNPNYLLLPECLVGATSSVYRRNLPLSVFKH